MVSTEVTTDVSVVVVVGAAVGLGVISRAVVVTAATGVVDTTSSAVEVRTATMVVDVTSKGDKVEEVDTEVITSGSDVEATTRVEATDVVVTMGLEVASGSTVEFVIATDVVVTMRLEVTSGSTVEFVIATDVVVTMGLEVASGSTVEFVIATDVVVTMGLEVASGSTVEVAIAGVLETSADGNTRTEVGTAISVEIAAKAVVTSTVVVSVDT